MITCGLQRGCLGRWLTIGGVSLAAAAVAMGGTITLTDDFRLNATAPSDLLSFQPFDSSLGLLTGVEITFTATRRHEWGLWNIDPTNPNPRSIAYESALTGTALTVNGHPLDFADVHYGRASTPALAPVSDDDFATDFFAGSGRFLTGQPANFAQAYNGGDLHTRSIAGALPLSFDGNLLFTYDPGVWVPLTFEAGEWTVLEAENAQAASLIDIYGQAQVTYTYDTVAVPDAFGYAWLPGVLAGLAWTARRPGLRTKAR